MHCLQLFKAVVPIILTTLFVASLHRAPLTDLDTEQQIVRQAKVNENVTCALSLKVSDFALSASGPSRPQKSWECELEMVGDFKQSRGRFKRLGGLSKDWVEKYAKEMVSGEAMLSIPAAKLSDEEVRIPSGQNPTIMRRKGNGKGKGKGKAKGQGQGRGQRRAQQISTAKNRNLQGIEGTREVLVIRVVGNDVATTATKRTLRDSIFGTHGDVVNLRSQYKACSFGKIEFVPTPDDRASDGVITVTIRADIKYSSDSKIREEVVAVATNSLGDLPSQFDLVMVCLPPGTKGDEGEWVAYAYVNSWLAVFNDDICTYPSYQVHETGHTLSLGHSGTLVDFVDEYGDQSGMMGYSYSVDEGPKLCFNGAKSWQFGWYSDRHVTFDPLESTQWGGRLIGAADYDKSSECTGECNVIVKIEAGAIDYYVAFNRRIRANVDSKYGADEVLVTTQAAGYSDSNLTAHLTAGQTYEIKNIVNRRDSVLVTVNSINIDADPGYAEVSIFLLQASTISPAPTPAPLDCAGGSLFSWTIATDQYPAETSWFLTKDGENFADGGFSDAYTKHSSERCLLHGKYVFTLRDQFGDGICCTYGSGGYELSLDGNIVGTGGEFAYEQRHEFEVFFTTTAPTRSPTTSLPAIAPLEDAYIRSGTKEVKNYGSSNTLSLIKKTNEQKVILKFDLSQQDVSIKSEATLRLYVVDVGSDEYRAIGVTLSRTTNWDENSVTWENFDATDTVEQAVTSFIVTPSNVNSWVDVNVSDLLSGATSLFAVFVLQIVSKISSGNKCEFYSREKDTFGPELIVVTPPFFTPIADTYVWSGRKAGKNFGSLTTLFLKRDSNERKAILKFDLSHEEVPDVFVATLHLYVADIGTDAQWDLRVARLSEAPSWDENSLTFDNFNPIVEHTGATVALTPSHANSWIEVDVSDHLVSATSRLVVFMLELVSSASSGSKLVFSSREDAAFSPELVVVPLPSFKPIADAFIWSDNREEDNYGSKSTLQLKKSSNERKALLKFEFGRDAASAALSITLRLYVAQIGGDEYRDVRVSRLPDSSFLDDNSVTWANLNQAIKQPGAVFRVFQSNVNSWIHVDVTEFAQNTSTGSVVLMLEIASSASGGNLCSFNSREKDTHAPRLIMQ